MLKKIIPENLHSFIKMVSIAIFFYGIGYALSAAATILVTRNLGPEGRGLITVILSVATIGGIISQCGMSTVSKKLAAENKEVAGQLFVLSIIICFLASIIIIPGFYYLSNSPQVIEYKNIFLLGLFLIPIMAIASIANEIFIGMHWNRQSNAIFIAEKCVYGVAVILLIIANKLSILNVILIFYISLLIKVIISIVFLRRYISIFHLKTLSSINLDKKEVLYNYLTSIFYTIAVSASTVLLTHYSNLEETGYLAAARVITDTISFLPSIYSGYAINKLILEKKKVSYQKTKLNINIIIMLAMLGICLFFYLISNHLIPILYGVEFIHSIASFNYLLPSIVFLSGLSFINSILLVEKKSHVMMVLSIIYSAFVVVLPFTFSAIDSVSIAKSISLASFITCLVGYIYCFYPAKNTKSRKRH